MSKRLLGADARGGSRDLCVRRRLRRRGDHRDHDRTAGLRRPRTTAAPSGEPIKIGFDEGFTSFMAYDCQLADQGIKTALDMLGNQYDGPAARVLPGGQRLRPGSRGRQGPETGRERQDQRHDRSDLLAVGKGGGRLPGQVVRHTADVHRRAADGEPGDRQWAGLHPHRLLRLPRVLLRQVPGGAGLQDSQRHQLR